MKKQKVYRIWPWSNMLGAYAPSLWPTKNTPEEAREFGKENIKTLDFEVRSE